MAFSTKRISSLPNAIGKARVLILGDIMLDEYQFGAVERISPEAPVPVVEIQSTRLLLGGAANVAANIRALGDEPLLMGTVGEDNAARKLNDLLAAKDISGDYMVVDPNRQTAIKTRVIAHSQQVVRVDRETRGNLTPEVEDTVIARASELIDKVDAVIISDYGKGVITKKVLDSVVGFCNEKGKFVAVDPKETNFPNYRGVSLITPNHHEAGFAYGHKIFTDEDLHKVGAGLLEKLDAQSILITQGGKGMSLFSRDGETTHIPTFARKVYDVTGAGDTVIAVFVSAVCAGAELAEAAVLANAGAGHTVGEIGTATVTVDQLKKEVEHNINNGNVGAAKNGNTRNHTEQKVEIEK